jgi:hypothetical protein
VQPCLRCDGKLLRDDGLDAVGVGVANHRAGFGAEHAVAGATLLGSVGGGGGDGGGGSGGGGGGDVGGGGGDSGGGGGVGGGGVGGGGGDSGGGGNGGVDVLLASGACNRPI